MTVCALVVSLMMNPGVSVCFCFLFLVLFTSLRVLLQIVMTTEKHTPHPWRVCQVSLCVRAYVCIVSLVLEVGVIEE